DELGDRIERVVHGDEQATRYVWLPAPDPALAVTPGRPVVGREALRVDRAIENADVGLGKTEVLAEVPLRQPANGQDERRRQRPMLPAFQPRERSGGRVECPDQPGGGPSDPRRVFEQVVGPRG